ncbi:MAG TPA: DUF5808 domain-containing protein [Candidatus Acidoferrales bacterium]|jgi:uncharacterized membrane protein|nr:DUF5808 domain-containing protein [Candidatus Acidoferrales bacterium]
MSLSNTASALAPEPTPMPGGWPLQLSPFAILVATSVYVGLHWSDIPDRFPVHWAASGNANGWSVRTPMGVFGPLLFGAVVMAIVAASSYGALHFGRPVHGSSARSVAGDFAREMGVFLLSLEFFLAVIFSFVGLLPLMGNHNPGIIPIAVATVAMLAALIFAMARLAKHHARVHAHAAELAPGAMQADHWKLGVFYVNRDDSALFVPKRFGIGYTLNFGHVAAWVIMALTLLVPVVLALNLMHLP